MVENRTVRTNRWGAAFAVMAILISSFVISMGSATPASAAAAAPHNRMGPGHPLRSGASLSSSNGFVTLTMQTNGDLAARAGSTLLWRSATSGRGNFAQVIRSGSLAVFNRANKMLWSTRTIIASGGAMLTVQNTGDLTLTLGNRLLWHTRTMATTLRAGVRLSSGQFILGAGGEKMVMQAGGNLAVVRGATTLWSSPTHVRGSFAAVRSDGLLIVYSPQRKPLWTSGAARGSAARMVVGGDGNVRVLSANGRVIWQSFTMRAPTAAQLSSRLLSVWGSRVTGTPAARADLLATSRNQTVASPCGGRVRVNIRVVRFLVQVTGSYKIKINNLVTGHGCDSGGHPKGRATDLGSATSLTTGVFTSFGSVAGPNNLALDRTFVQYASTILPNGAGLGQSNCAGRSGAHPRAGVQFFADSCNHQHIQVQPSR